MSSAFRDRRMLFSDIMEDFFVSFQLLSWGKDKDRRYHDTQKVFTIIEELFSV